MRVSLLGDLDVRDGECLWTPHAPKPRQLIAVLALNANQVVSTALLMEELWGTTPPNSASTTLQTYVFQLRMSLTYTPACNGDRAKARDRLLTKPLGYQLNLGTDELDVFEFKGLCQRASDLGSTGDHSGAVDLYERALSLCHAPALHDVRQGLLLTAHARQLEELRLNAAESCIRHLIELGRFPEAITALSALTVRHPLHEGLHTQLIRALCGAGRRSESLKVYQDIRSRLINEVGIEPSVALQVAQQQALCCDSHAS